MARLRLVAVDVGAAGMLRRLGIEGPYRTIARNLRLPLRERYIDWEDVDPLETSIAGVQACACPTRASPSCTRPTWPRSSISSRRATAPECSPSLDDEEVADAIEEMEPETQVEVLEDLEPDRAADILEEMSPDDAADLVADLSEAAREEILSLMEKDEAEEVKELLGYPGGVGRRDHDDRVHRAARESDGRPGDRPTARAGAGRRDDLLRLRRGPVGAARRRAVAARPDRGQARDARFPR